MWFSFIVSSYSIFFKVFTNICNFLFAHHMVHLLLMTFHRNLIWLCNNSRQKIIAQLLEHGLLMIDDCTKSVCHLSFSRYHYDDVKQVDDICCLFIQTYTLHLTQRERGKDGHQSFIFFSFFFLWFSLLSLSMLIEHRNAKEIKYHSTSCFTQDTYMNAATSE